LIIDDNNKGTNIMTDQEWKDSDAKIADMRDEIWREIDEIKRMQKETDRILKENEERMQSFGIQLGGVSNNYGFHAEQLFQDAFERKPVFGGIKYKRMQPNYILGKDENKKKIEVDIALFNGDSVALIEVKNRIHPDFVEEFAQKRVRKFRESCAEYNNYKLYLGIAGFSFDNKVLEKAKEYGVGIVKQAGEGIDVEADCLKAY